MIRAEHELHHRRRSRNMGVLAVLLSFIAIIFGLTVVKVEQLGAAQSFDRPVGEELLPGEEAPS